MKYFVTYCLDTEEKSKIEEKGLYCYDLRSRFFEGGIGYIEKSVLINRIGSMITNEKIPLGDKYPDDYVKFETFIAGNQAVNKIEKLYNNTKAKVEEKQKARKNKAKER